MYCHGGHGGFEFLVQEITAILIDRDILWEFNSIVMQTSPFFSINQYDQLSRERNYPRGKIYYTRRKFEKKEIVKGSWETKKLVVLS